MHEVISSLVLCQENGAANARLWRARLVRSRCCTYCKLPGRRWSGATVSRQPADAIRLSMPKPDQDSRPGATSRRSSRSDIRSSLPGVSGGQARGRQGRQGRPRECRSPGMTLGVRRAEPLSTRWRPALLGILNLRRFHVVRFLVPTTEPRSPSGRSGRADWREGPYLPRGPTSSASLACTQLPARLGSSPSVCILHETTILARHRKAIRWGQCVWVPGGDSKNAPLTGEAWRGVEEQVRSWSGADHNKGLERLEAVPIESVSFPGSCGTVRPLNSVAHSDPVPLFWHLCPHTRYKPVAEAGTATRYTNTSRSLPAPSVGRRRHVFHHPGRHRRCRPGRSHRRG